MPENTEDRLSWRCLRGEILTYRRPLLIAHIIAVLATLISVPIPLLMPLMVDEVLLGQPGPAVATLNEILPPVWQTAAGYILTMFILTVVLRVSSVLLSVVQSREFTIIGKSVTFRLRQRLLRRLGLVAMSEYETMGTGGLSSHFVTDMETIDQFIGETLSKLLISSLTVVGVAAVLLLIDWRLGLFILLCNPVVIYFSKVLGSRVKELKREENSAFELFQQALVETLDAVQEIRAANRERHYLLRVMDRARGVRNHAIAYAWKSDAAGRLSFLIFLIGFELFRAVAMLMVVFSDLTVGQIFAVFGYLWFMMSPINELLGIQYAFYSASAALKRLDRLSEHQQEPQYPSLRDPFASGRGVSIEVEDLHFRYEVEQEVLRGVDLRIELGERVAIVGASGGGKSTLIQLLLGLYTPDSGYIRYGGVDMREIGLQRVREHVATVLQHPTLFNDSVRENLCMGKSHDDSQILEALAVAELADFVRAQPAGLDTPIGSRGVKLSGGQRQRLAIARMVLRDPSVVILDEATSALDTETEARVHANLARFLADRTTLIVAHRLSAVRQASTIYVFEDGLICQSGHHEDLIREDGLYRTLYAGQ
jgi:ATP-binding cassette subfamily C protein